MTDTRNTIPAGPGFVGGPDVPNEYGADVEVEMVYAPQGDTVAALILFARNVEAPFADVAVGVELTTGDLRRLIEWAEAMVAAAEEDIS